MVSEAFLFGSHKPSSLVLTSFENQNEGRLFREPIIQTFIVHLSLIATTLASQDLSVVTPWQDLFTHSVMRLMPLSTVTDYTNSAQMRNFASVTKPI